MFDRIDDEQVKELSTLPHPGEFKPTIEFEDVKEQAKELLSVKPELKHNRRYKRKLAKENRKRAKHSIS